MSDGIRPVGIKWFGASLCATLIGLGCSPAVIGQVPEPQDVRVAIPQTATRNDRNIQSGTLCGDGEKVYFSCPLEGKIASICAKDNLEPKSGHVQYRYGTQANLEMVFPPTKVPPEGKFSYREVNEGSIQQGVVTFTNNGYKYVVFNGYFSGIYVLADNKVLLRKTCESDPRQHFAPDVMTGLPNEPAEINDSR
ncbi:MAG: hypothetical protein ACREPV_14035 [Lysobacter sp.]